MDKISFRHVVIVGCGLLGTSLGLALRKRGLAEVITGVGRASSGSVATALGRGAINRGTADLVRAVRGEALAGENSSVAPADLVVLCTPIRQFPEAFRLMAPALARGTLVTDAGSTKQVVLEWAEKLLPPSPAVKFVGSHPMAGSEKSGPEAARDDLYEHAICLLCSRQHGDAGGQVGSSDVAVAQIRQMWEALGMRVIELSAATHDRWVAAISHLPHAVAFSLVNAVAQKGNDPSMLEAVAGGFLDTTRVASSDAAMWTDIFLTNKQAIIDAIDQFRDELDSLRAAIASGDEAAIRNAISAARETRNQLLVMRKRAGLSTRSMPDTPVNPGD